MSVPMRQRITLEIAYDETEHAPPAEWAWPTLLDVDDAAVTLVAAEAPVPAPDPVIESPSGWSYRESQENGDQVDCNYCGDPLDDNYPIVNDAEGYAYHGEPLDCLTRGTE